MCGVYDDTASGYGGGADCCSSGLLFCGFDNVCDEEEDSDPAKAAQG